MNRTLPTILVALSVGLALAWSPASPGPTSQSVQTEEDVLPKPLRSFVPLIGEPWVTTFPNGLTDTQVYEPMVNGRFLRNVHHVRTAEGRVVYEGETVYGWDAETEQIRWWYYNSTGGWIDGTVEEPEEGGWVFEGENHAPQQQTARVRSSSRLVSGEEADRLEVTTWFWRDETWQVERELVYTHE